MEKTGFLGVIMIVAGIVLGLYTGVWLCFIGGIVDVIQQVRADQLSAVAVAVGVAKVVFSGLAGLISACLLILPGYALIK